MGGRLPRSRGPSCRFFACAQALPPGAPGPFGRHASSRSPRLLNLKLALLTSPSLFCESPRASGPVGWSDQPRASGSSSSNWLFLSLPSTPTLGDGGPWGCPRGGREGWRTLQWRPGSSPVGRNVSSRGKGAGGLGWEWVRKPSCRGAQGPGRGGEDTPPAGPAQHPLAGPPGTRPSVGCPGACHSPAGASRGGGGGWASAG